MQRFKQIVLGFYLFLTTIFVLRYESSRITFIIIPVLSSRNQNSSPWFTWPQVLIFSVDSLLQFWWLAGWGYSHFDVFFLKNLSYFSDTCNFSWHTLLGMVIFPLIASYAIRSTHLLLYSKYAFHSDHACLKCL